MSIAGTKNRHLHLWVNLICAFAAALGIAPRGLWAQPMLNSYFAHIAAADVWTTTFTYVNPSTLPVTCNTNFYSDSGDPLFLSFNGVMLSSTSDNIQAEGVARRQTDSQPGLPVVTGWATASCTGPVKASALFRRYDGIVPVAEASVIAMTSPDIQFVTYADQSTGVAYANPSQVATTVTFTANDLSGTILASQNISLPAGTHGSRNIGPLLGLSSFQGSIEISSSAPIVSLSLNSEAPPIISSLPPGELDDGLGNAPSTYYIAHTAGADVWRTTFTYINPSTQNVTCKTAFYSDSGNPLTLPFNGRLVLLSR